MNNGLEQVEFKSTTVSDGFVGLRYKKDKIHIYLPLGYNITHNNNMELRSDILLLLKSITLVKSYDNTKTDFGFDIGNKEEMPFNSFLWIISDYLTNGLYQEIEKKYTQNGHGKINWKRTLSSTPYYVDDNPIFINPYYETNTYKNNIITELNTYCVKVSYKYIGFLFGNIKIPVCSLKAEQIKCNKRYYLDIINKELARTYNDRKKQLLLNMKRIIDTSYDKDSLKIASFGTYKYEYVWEKLVNEVFGTKNIKINDYFPEAYWYLLHKGKVKDSSKLRPDTILKDNKNNKIYILDAKYYKYGVTNDIKDLPSIDSIQKQITYGDNIAINSSKYNNIKVKNIYNAFILPFNKDKNEFAVTDNICYEGYAESSWKKVEDESSYQKIALILVDIKYLIDCYYKKEKVKIEDLITCIEKVNSEQLNDLK